MERAENTDIPVLIVGEVITGEPGNRVTTRYELGTVYLDTSDGTLLGVLAAMRTIPEALRSLADDWDAKAATIAEEGR